MRIPVPRNKLVAFTLIGAILTGFVAVGLAVPGFGLVGSADSTGSSPTTPAAADAPTPNPDFMPAVSRSGADNPADHEEEWEDDDAYEDEDEHEEDEAEDEEYEDEQEEDEAEDEEDEEDHEESEDR